MFRSIFFLALTLFSSVSFAELKTILVSISPLHSVVSYLTMGVHEPRLLLSANISPHEFQLKPSQRRLIGNADLIIWVDHELETTLERTLDQYSEKVFGLNEYRNYLNLLDIREDAIFGNGAGHNHESGADPHFWLDPANTIGFAKAVVDKLSALDPANTNVYELNLEKFIAELTRNNEAWLMALGEKQNILSVHDGFQYFESAFNLNHIGALQINSEVGMSLKRIAAIREMIKTDQIQCLFSEPQYNQNRLKILVEGTKTKIARLDTLGTQLTPGKMLYLEMMQNNVDSVLNCFE